MKLKKLNMDSKKKVICSFLPIFAKTINKEQ